jgi:hypothetical protein
METYAQLVGAALDGVRDGGLEHVSHRGGGVARPLVGSVVLPDHSPSVQEGREPAPDDDFKHQKEKADSRRTRRRREEHEQIISVTLRNPLVPVEDKKRWRSCKAGCPIMRSRT